MTEDENSGGGHSADLQGFKRHGLLHVSLSKILATGFGIMPFGNTWQRHVFILFHLILVFLGGTVNFLGHYLAAQVLDAASGSRQTMATCLPFALDDKPGVRGEMRLLPAR